MITDVLFTSPILHSEDYGGMGVGAADGTNGMVTDVVGGGPGGMAGFGADFENDPELAQALMISMQEQRAKQNEEAKGDDAAGSQVAPNPSVADIAMHDGGDDSHDEDYYIQQAMQLSLAEAAPTDTPQAKEEAAPQVDIKDVVNTDFMKDLVNQLDLDLGEDGLGDLVNDANNGEEEKKD